MDDPVRIADELRRLEEGSGFVPLADVGLLRVTGAGHRDVLQRVLTQDLWTLRQGGGCLALLLAPKGQFRAVMAVFAGAEETLLMVPEGRGEELAAMLKRYLTLSRCSAQSVPDSGGATAIVGARWTQAAAAVGADAKVLMTGGWHGGATGSGAVSWFGRSLLGVPGAVVTGGGEEVRERLRSQGIHAVMPEAVGLARIRRGAPAWGTELTETVLPPEVGIADETISYTKGCYIGQETMSRMKTYGHPTRALVGVRQLFGEPVPPGLPSQLSEAANGRARGALTSWGLHPDLGGVGLALIRREVADPGTRLIGAGRKFEVAGFPLW